MDLAAERTRLLQRDAEWATAASEGRDLERILSYWTDDAVVLAPGLPVVVGKDALRLYVQAVCRFPGSGLPGPRPMSPSHQMEIWRTCSARMR
jgi:ketosteroid isomerase-like protein